MKNLFRLILMGALIFGFVGCDGGGISPENTLPIDGDKNNTASVISPVSLNIGNTTQEQIKTIIIPINPRDVDNRISTMTCTSNPNTIDFTNTNTNITINMPKYSNIQEFTIECIAKDSQSVELDRDSVVVKVLPFTTKLKKTGQTTTYSNYDDGYYQKGAINYTRDDTKQIVIDHITGLEWQDDTNISKPWLTQANYNAGNYSDTSGDTATTYCSTLTLGGYNDWRLPTVKELFYIVDNSKINPTIDSHFQNVVSDDYWSSTSDARYTNYAWYVYFYDGTTYTVVRTIVTMFVV